MTSRRASGESGDTIVWPPTSNDEKRNGRYGHKADHDDNGNGHCVPPLRCNDD